MRNQADPYFFIYTSFYITKFLFYTRIHFKKTQHYTINSYNIQSVFELYFYSMNYTQSKGEDETLLDAKLRSFLKHNYHF